MNYLSKNFRLTLGVSLPIFSIAPKSEQMHWSRKEVSKLDKKEISDQPGIAGKCMRNFSHSLLPNQSCIITDVTTTKSGEGAFDVRVFPASGVREVSKQLISTGKWPGLACDSTNKAG